MTQEPLRRTDLPSTDFDMMLTATALGMTFSKPVAEEIREARSKYGALGTPQNTAMPPLRKLAILVEEVGEVARALGTDGADADPAELLQVATMALLWYDSLTRLADRPTDA